MDPKKQAAMKAAMKLISEDLGGISDKDILSKLENKQAKKTPDAGLSDEDAIDLMDGMNPDIEAELSKDGGVEIEVKKPVQVRPGADGGVQVDAGTMKIEKKPLGAGLKKNVDKILQDVGKGARKLNEDLKNANKNLTITPEMRQLREQLREAAKNLNDGPILDDSDLDTIINFIKGKKEASDGGME